MVDFEFFTDPVAFVDRARGFLRADPVVSTVVAAVAESAAADDAAGVQLNPDVPRWWVVAAEGSGSVVGVAMRTAPAPPYPIYVLPMPDEYAVELGRLLADRGDAVTMVNGALPAARVLAGELARRAGGSLEDGEHNRLFEATLIEPPARVPAGGLRLARREEADLVEAWFGAFRGDANEQAGRARDSTPEIGRHDRADIDRRIARERVWLWVDEDDQPVHLTATSLPAQGVVRIGPVYTPPSLRGRGYAGAAVAGVSQRILDEGLRSCLFTDQANPTSNALYLALGYRPLVDMVSVNILPR